MKTINSLFAAAALSFLAACTPQTAEKEKAYVAVIGPMTGTAAIYGEWLRNGIQAAVEGGVDNVEFELLDSGGDPKTAVTLARKAIDKPNAIAVWATTSGENMAVRDMVTQAGLSLVTSSATSPEITDGREGVYRTIVNTRQETQALVDFAMAELEPKRVVVLYINDAGGQASRDQFKLDFEQKGVPVLLDDSFEKTPQDTRVLALKALAKKPDLVVVTGYTAAMGKIVKSVRNADSSVAILCNHGLDIPENMSLPGNVLNNVYFSFAKIDESVAGSEFNRLYKEKYGLEPGLYPISAYDTANLISKSVAQSGANKAKFRAAMHKSEGKGVNGDYTFTSSGNVLKSLSIYKLTKGVKQKLKEVAATAD